MTQETLVAMKNQSVLSTRVVQGKRQAHQHNPQKNSMATVGTSASFSRWSLTWGCCTPAKMVEIQARWRGLITCCRSRPALVFGIHQSRSVLFETRSQVT